MFGVNVARHGKARLQDLLGVGDGRLQQLSEVLVLGHVLVAEREPLADRLGLVDQDLEEGVHEEDAIVNDARTVQQHGLHNTQGVS